MIPPFEADGNLPPGVYSVQWSELEARFGTNAHRKRLLTGLSDALEQFRIAGCRRVYIDGSFVTAKAFPNDYDVCYDARGVDPMFLDAVFLDVGAGRSKQKAKYGGEFFPSSVGAAPGHNFLQFFQIDKDNGNSKGILAIDLGTRP